MDNDEEAKTGVSAFIGMGCGLVFAAAFLVSIILIISGGWSWITGTLFPLIGGILATILFPLLLPALMIKNGGPVMKGVGILIYLALLGLIGCFFGGPIKSEPKDT